MKEEEIITVVNAWWQKHGINGNFHQLRHYTLPKTFTFVEPYLPIIEQNCLEGLRIQQSNRRAKRKAEDIALCRRAEPTADRIVKFIAIAGVVKAAQIPDSVGLSVDVAKRQLSRLTKKGVISRIGSGSYGPKVVNNG